MKQFTIEALNCKNEFKLVGLISSSSSDVGPKINNVQRRPHTILLPHTGRLETADIQLWL